MQDYYNSISTARRIAFIDNLTHEQARVLSNQYKYVVCFASKELAPSIWYQGQRYGGTVLDDAHTTVHVGNYDIYLNLSVDGKLGITSEKLYSDDLLYFIGSSDYINELTNESLSFYINDESIETIDNWSTAYINKWVKIPSNRIVNLTTDNIGEINTYDLTNCCIIVPIEYNVCVPIYQNNQMNSPITDSTVSVIGDQLTINEHQYKIYKFDNENSIINNIIC